MHSSWGSGCVIAAASCPTPFSHTLLIFCLVPLLVPLGARVFAHVALLPLIYSGEERSFQKQNVRRWKMQALQIGSPASFTCCSPKPPTRLGGRLPAATPTGRSTGRTDRHAHVRSPTTCCNRPPLPSSSTRTCLNPAPATLIVAALSGRSSTSTGTGTDPTGAASYISTPRRGEWQGMPQRAESIAYGGSIYLRGFLTQAVSPVVPPS